MSHVVIIGNGIAGVTTARHIRKRSNDRITIISSETDHFFSRTALMYIYMGHMKYEHTKPYEDHFWKKNKIDLKKAHVSQIDFKSKNLTLLGGDTMSYDKLVLAVGSKPNKFGWEGEHLEGVQGLYSYQDLESMEAKSKDLKRAVIVGGGLIGIEMAEMFLSRKIPVTFLVREHSFWSNVLPKEEAKMISNHIIAHHVDLRLETELDKIVDDGTGKVKGIITKEGEEIACGFVGLTVGVSPNIEFLKKSALETNKGILVNRYLETNIQDVFAVGDCVEMREPLPNRRSIEQVWYTGKIQGETLAYTLTGDRKEYNPGVWFNSAKFFDVEYQTYGWVWNKVKETEKTLFWKHPSKNICIRINYDKFTKAVLGFNVFGVRYRQEVCVKWIEEQRDIEYVLEHLSQANFDPEFFKQHEKEIINVYNEQNPGRELKLKRKKGLFSLRLT